MLYIIIMSIVCAVWIIMFIDYIKNIIPIICKRVKNTNYSNKIITEEFSDSFIRVMLSRVMITCTLILATNIAWRLKIGLILNNRKEIFYIYIMIMILLEYKIKYTKNNLFRRWGIISILSIVLSIVFSIVFISNF